MSSATIPAAAATSSGSTTTTATSASSSVNRRLDAEDDYFEDLLEGFYLYDYQFYARGTNGVGETFIQNVLYCSRGRIVFTIRIRRNGLMYYTISLGKKLLGKCDTRDQVISKMREYANPAYRSVNQAKKGDNIARVIARSGWRVMSRKTNGDGKYVVYVTKNGKTSNYSVRLDENDKFVFRANLPGKKGQEYRVVTDMLRAYQNYK